MAVIWYSSVNLMRLSLLPLLLLLIGCLDETADLSPPVVVITSPSRTIVSGIVTFSASAVDDYGVDKVQFYVGNTLLMEDRAPPYEGPWGTFSNPDGDIQIRVIATDLSGNTAQAAKTVTVSNVRD